MILRESGSPQPGSYLAFLVRIQTVDPSAFEMPDAPAKKPGFFLFSSEVRSKSALAQSLRHSPSGECPLSEGKPDIGIVQHNDRLWLLSGLSRAIYPGPIYEFAP